MIDKKYDIAISASVMDLLHDGHRELLEMMRSYARMTVIFLHDDKSTFLNKGKFPVQSFDHRRRNLLSTGLVDYVIKVNSTTPADNFLYFIKNVNTKKIVYVRGDDMQIYPGRQVIEDFKIKTIFKKYTAGVSSTKLRDELNK